MVILAPCQDNEVFETCGTACETTCENLNQDPAPCTMQCKEGCFCEDGFVKDGKEWTVRKLRQKNNSSLGAMAYSRGIWHDGVPSGNSAWWRTLGELGMMAYPQGTRHDRVPSGNLAWWRTLGEPKILESLKWSMAISTAKRTTVSVNLSNLSATWVLLHVYKNRKLGLYWPLFNGWDL